MSSAEVAVGLRTWDTGTFGRMIHRKIKLVEIYRMVKSVSLYLFRSRSYKAVNVVLAKMNAGKCDTYRKIWPRYAQNWSPFIPKTGCLKTGGSKTGCSKTGKNDVIIKDGASNGCPLYTTQTAFVRFTVSCRFYDNFEIYKCTKLQLIHTSTATYRNWQSKTAI